MVNIASKVSTLFISYSVIFAIFAQIFLMLNKPNFLCIGAQKAGTSWLWVMLNQHPGIWMPPFKELHFFDHKFIENNRNWTLGHLKKGVKDSLRWHIRENRIDLSYFKYLIDIVMEEPFTEPWYFRCFDRPLAQGKILGDITPEYSTLPIEGVKYVKKLLGKNLKIIYLIRKPYDRALSQVKMNLSRRGEQNTDLEHWQKEAENFEINQRGDYKTYIKNWEKVFGSDNILYLPFKQIRKNPTNLLLKIEDHLSLDKFENYNNVEQKIHANATVRVPQEIRKFLKDSHADQLDFLKKKFGVKFCREI